jgi:hypothetical protein
MMICSYFSHFIRTKNENIEYSISTNDVCRYYHYPVTNITEQICFHLSDISRSADESL